MREVTHDGDQLKPILDAQMSKMSPEQRVAMASLNEAAKRRDEERRKWDEHLALKKLKENAMEKTEIIDADRPDPEYVPDAVETASPAVREAEEKCLPDPLQPKVDAATPTVECMEQGCQEAVDTGVTNYLRYTQETLADEFFRVFKEEIMALRNAGQKEYAHDAQSPFANFERGAKDMGIDRKQVLWVYAMKHKDGIAADIKGHTSQREDVRGRINDLIVYLLLLRGIYNEEAGNTGNFGLGDQA